MQFLPQLFEPLDKAAPKALGEEKGRAAIGASGGELKLTGTLDTLVERHGAEEYTRDDAGPAGNVPSGDRGSPRP